MSYGAEERCSLFPTGQSSTMFPAKAPPKGNSAILEIPLGGVVEKGSIMVFSVGGIYGIADKPILPVHPARFP